jgi:hypothetical protein
MQKEVFIKLAPTQDSYSSSDSSSDSETPDRQKKIKKRRIGTSSSMWYMRPRYLVPTVIGLVIFCCLASLFGGWLVFQINVGKTIPWNGSFFASDNTITGPLFIASNDFVSSGGSLNSVVSATASNTNDIVMLANTLAAFDSIRTTNATLNSTGSIMVLDPLVKSTSKIFVQDQPPQLAIGTIKVYQIIPTIGYLIQSTLGANDSSVIVAIQVVTPPPQ